MHGSLVDSKGEWGGLRVIDLSDPVAARVVTTWRPPEAATFPPKDLGVYAPGPAVTSGSVAYVAWHAAGLRALQVGAVGTPKELGAFIPPPQADPTKTLPTDTDVVGVAVTPRYVVAVDTNSGLYVLSPAAGNGTGGGSGVVPVAATAAIVVVAIAVAVGLGVRITARRH